MSIHIENHQNIQVAPRVLMPGDPVRAKYIAENFLENAQCYSSIRNMYGYTGTYKGVPVSVQGSGMGMPSMGIYSWELITEFDVKKIIRIGTAGSFHEKIQLGDVVMGLAASTDSNFVHTFDIPFHYAPSASWTLTETASLEAKKQEIPLHGGNIVSCDVFYETDSNWWKKWARMNVLAVEMEAAALYMNAAYHQVDALALVTITDHFITKEKASKEQRAQANSKMITLALDTVITE